MRFEVRELLRLKLHMRQQAGYQAAFGAVFDQISVWENATSGSTRPSQTMIAAALGQMARETVCRAVVWLRRLGYIRTRQTYVRQADGSVLHGPLIYWISRDTVQAGILKGKGLMARYRELMQRGLKRSSSYRGVMAGGGVAEAESSYARLMAEGLAKSRCDMAGAIPPRSESNVERLGARDGNLASPALQRLLKDQDRRR